MTETKKKTRKPQLRKRQIPPVVARLPEYPWERMPRETNEAWEAFVVYREMGLNRSLAKVATQLGKSTPLMERWSQNWRWVSRVREWDFEQDKREQEAKLVAVQDMKKRQLELSRGFLVLVGSELRKLVNESKAAKTSILSADQLQRLGDFATKLERLNMDEPGEIKREHRELTTNEKRRYLRRIFEGDAEIEDALEVIFNGIEKE